MDLQQICVKLWCEVPAGSGNCKTAEMPSADGTPCGNNKVIYLLFRLLQKDSVNNKQRNQIYVLLPAIKQNGRHVDLLIFQCRKAQ